MSERGGSGISGCCSRSFLAGRSHTGGPFLESVRNSGCAHLKSCPYPGASCASHAIFSSMTRASLFTPLVIRGWMASLSSNRRDGPREGADRKLRRQPMRLVIERGELLRALGHVTSVVERRTTIPILSNVLLKASGQSPRAEGDRPRTRGHRRGARGSRRARRRHRARPHPARHRAQAARGQPG